jgi:hypothetical protein
METIEDVRREEGNPRATPVVAGPPRSIFSFFTGTSAAQLVAILLIALGGIVVFLGAVLALVPLMLAGLAGLLMAIFVYAWGRQSRPAIH